MRKYLEYAWPVIGLAAVVFSFWLLYRELKIISASAVLDAILAIPPRHWIGAIGATVVAYGALAWYDRIALLHLGRRLPVRSLLSKSVPNKKLQQRALISPTRNPYTWLDRSPHSGQPAGGFPES